MKILVGTGFLIIMDLLELVLFLVPLYDPEDVHTDVYRKTGLTILAYIAVRLVWLLCVMFTTEFGSVLFGVSMLFKAVIIYRYLATVEKAGVNLSLLSLFLSVIFLHNARQTSQLIHDTLFSSIAGLDIVLSENISMKVYLDQYVITLLIMAAVSVCMHRCFRKYRKTDDSDFAKITLLAFMAMVYELMLKGNGILELVGMYLVPVLFLLLMDEMFETFAVQHGMEQVRRTLELNREQIELLDLNQTCSLRSKHEILQHLNMIQRFLEHKEYEAAQLYIRETAGIMESEIMPVYSKNTYVNSVIACRKKSDPETIFDVTCETGEDCGVDSIDLSSVVLNLIDDRIRRKADDRHLKLVISERENTVSVLIDSKVSTPVMSEMEKTVVENIAREYHGAVYQGVKTETDTAVLLRKKEKHAQ